jgi:hypothetical protein
MLLMGMFLWLGLVTFIIAREELRTERHIRGVIEGLESTGRVIEEIAL